MLSGSHSVSQARGGQGGTVAKLDTCGAGGGDGVPHADPRARPMPVRTSAPRLLKFHAPEIVFGIDSMVEAAHAALRLGALRPMLVTDPGLIEAGWADEMVGHLAEQGVTALPVERADPQPQGPRDRRRLPEVRRARLRRARRGRRRVGDRRGQGGGDPGRQRRRHPGLRGRGQGARCRSRRWWWCRRRRAPAPTCRSSASSPTPPATPRSRSSVARWCPTSPSSTRGC